MFLWRFSKALVVLAEFHGIFSLPSSGSPEDFRLRMKNDFLLKEVKNHFAPTLDVCLSWRHCSSIGREHKKESQLFAEPFRPLVGSCHTRALSSPVKKANTALQLGRTTWIKPEHRPSTVSSLNHKYKGEKGFCESYHEMIILAVKVHNFFKLVQIFWSKENLVKNHSLRDASLPLHCMLGNMYSTLYILDQNT